MIWARPLSRDLGAGPLLKRFGNSAQNGEARALLTGLNESQRALLMQLAGSSWSDGPQGTGVLRYAPDGLDAWCSRLAGTELWTAFRRLDRLSQPPPPTICGAQRFDWGRRPRIMGIVNVTPDSFSDGGLYARSEEAIAHGVALAHAGAEILDVGGESTRPGAEGVSELEEMRRVVPVIEGLRSKLPQLVLSADTRRASVARAAAQAGVQIINDVSGLRDDSMIEVVAELGLCACVMHMRGVPQTMQQDLEYDDVGAEILDELEGALCRAEARGIPRSRLWVDPGIGFGKSAAQNVFLLRRAIDFRLLGAPVLIGVSRKAFLGALVGGKEPKDRLVASATTVGILAAEGVIDVARVHDVAQTKDALAVGEALREGGTGGTLFSN